MSSIFGVAIRERGAITLVISSIKCTALESSSPQINPSVVDVFSEKLNATLALIYQLIGNTWEWKLDPEHT